MLSYLLIALLVSCETNFDLTPRPPSLTGKGETRSLPSPLRRGAGGEVTSHPTESAERQLLYAESLFDQHAYGAARLEYKRFLFYHSDTEMSDFVHYRIAQSRYYAQDYAAALQAFEDFTATFPTSPLWLRAQFMFGKAYYDLGEYATARSIFFQVLNADEGDNIKEAAQYLRGWSYLYEKEWLKAIPEFRKVAQFDADPNLAQVATDLADTTLAGTPLPLKSPGLASFMSTLLPGSGQIYGGKVGNGLIATAVNAAFFYLLVDAIRDERYVDSVGIYLVGSRFYWGNRFNARKFAIEHNQRVEEDFLRQLKQIEKHHESHECEAKESRETATLRGE